MKAAGSLFAIENKDVEAHTRTFFWEKESLATTVNAAKTTMHNNKNKIDQRQMYGFSLNKSKQ